MEMKFSGQIKRNLTNKKFAFVKQFAGDPKGGGQIIFMKCYEIIGEHFNSILVEPVFKKVSRRTFVNRLILNPLNIVLNNLVCSRLLKEGYEIFSDSDCGTVRYLQPMSENLSPSFTDILVWRINRLLDIISRFGKNNLHLIIYNSYFTSLRFGYSRTVALERILYPGILKNKPNPSLITTKEDFIVTISRISPEKNLEIISEIIKGIGFKHYLIGYCTDYKYLEYLKGKIPESIIIPNAGEEIKADLLGKAKILLHTAINEPAGMIYMEAFSYGTVPIAHNSGGTKEIVPQEFLFDENREAREKIIKYIKTYNGELGNNLMVKSEKFMIQSFRDNLLSIILDYFSHFDST